MAFNLRASVGSAHKNLDVSWVKFTMVTDSKTMNSKVVSAAESL